MSKSFKPIRFAGYAALFDIPDAANDMIERGAFARSISARSTPIPLFWQHRPDQPIGTIEHIAEDDHGLRVIGQLDNHRGRAARQLSRGEVDGLSFGFRARRFLRAGQCRKLSEIELIEVSLVTHPLQHGARVHFVDRPQTTGAA